MLNLFVIKSLEPLYQQLKVDYPIYRRLHTNTVDLITKCFGDQGWVKLYNKKTQRDEQRKKLQKSYSVPSQEYTPSLQSFSLSSDTIGDKEDCSEQDVIRI